MKKEYLFHYTRAENYKKILDEQTLLLNNINKTNDPYENKKYDFFDLSEIRKCDETNEYDEQKIWFFNFLNSIKNRIVKTLSFSQGLYNFEVLNEKKSTRVFFT